ncbi:uncharacterized protein Z520_09740 [Fonsecaea multimorphosa CBS 102226]|uniref:Rhodopsin domain-containing protein n=1 Tax=Fonsecaea multimorphosa CBS 102226 TaxID=1442371 RepID=A0A0D2JW16_9EURO|nr:uncharacterized protein Z520_09740 [Fonsecaea multimorphosa CBS 102226]KIX94694.1 hypothetical protein Z520_09740 [Fonsecaea multimorphosa CBS 102226]
MASSVRPQGWPLPNFDDPPKRGAPALFIVMCAVTATVVMLRLWSRYSITKSPGMDDALLVAGFLLSIGQTVAEYKALTTCGWNMHLWDVPLDRLEYVRLSAWLIELFFLLGNACVKISILLVYRKLSSRSHSIWFIRLTWAAIIFTIVYTFGLVLELLVICRPLSSYWQSYNPEFTGKYTCGNEQVPIVFSAAASAFSDIYASVLPMLWVRNLNLTSKQRFSLYALFSAGLLTAGIGIARMTYFVKVTTNYQLGPDTHDVTWYGWPTFALTDIEAHLAIICASAPALKALFQRLISPKMSSYLHVSTPTDTSDRAPSRGAQFQSCCAEHESRSKFYFKRTFKGFDATGRSQRTPSHSEELEHDIENLSLQTMTSNKPLTTPSSIV